MGPYTIYVYSFFSFFDHSPTPSLHSFTLALPPTYCKRLHLKFDHSIQYVPTFTHVNEKILLKLEVSTFSKQLAQFCKLK